MMDFREMEENDEDYEDKSEPVFKFRKAKNKSSREKDFIAQSQHYFESASAAAQINTNEANPGTSIDQSKIPLIDSQKFATISRDLEDSHQEHIDALLEKYEMKFFTKWVQLMHAGFNILLQGYGSKINLMEQFRLIHLMDFNHVIIKGFYPGLSLKHVMNSLADNVELSHSFTPNSLDKFCSAFADHLERLDFDLFLIIPSIDVALVKVNKLQQLFLSIAKLPRVHFIASIDHINADLLWDQHSKYEMNWLKFDCTTFENYNVETSFENSFLHNSTGSLALSSLANVAHSLTPNAKKILEVIINFYLKNDDSKNPGMLFQQCYLQCRESFLVNSDLALRAQLTEFIDHGLVSMKKNSEGGELIILNLTKSVMTTYLENSRAA